MIGVGVGISDLTLRAPLVRQPIVAGDDQGHIFKSLDGVSWSNLGLVTGQPAGNVAIMHFARWGRSYYAVDTSGNFYKGTDGDNWSAPQAVAPGVEFDTLATDGTTLVLTTDTTSHSIMHSSDAGATWAEVRLSGGGQTVGCVAAGQGLFVAGTDDSNICTSSNGGVTWSTHSVGSPNPGLWEAACSGSTFIVAGGDDASNTHPAMVYRSTDGTTWSAGTQILGTGFAVTGLTYGRGIWVLGTGKLTDSTGGHVFYSTDDGVTWNDVGDITGTNHAIQSCCYANGIFVAGDYNGHVFASLNGINWSAGVDIGGAGVGILCLA